MNTFAPVFSQITESSLWSEEDFVCKAFITLLAIKDMNHIAHVNAFVLGKKCWPGDPTAEKKALDAIKILSSPDTKRIEKQEHDGRRIKKTEDGTGYLILNGHHYEKMASEFKRRLYKAKKEREYRMEKSQVKAGRSRQLAGEASNAALERAGATQEELDRHQASTLPEPLPVQEPAVDPQPEGC